MTRTKSETIVDARTSGVVAGETVVKEWTHLDGRPLDDFEAIQVFLDVTTPPGGTVPEITIYLQLAIKPNPDVDTDTDWSDYFSFVGITDVSAAQWKAQIPVPIFSVSVPTGQIAEVPQTAALADGKCIGGFFGDRLRILESMLGTDLTAAVWSIHAVGMIRASE